MECVLERSQVVATGLDQAFAFFAAPRNLEVVTPPWLRFRIVAAPAELRGGSRLRYRLRIFGCPVRWNTEIVSWRPPRSFTDVQLSGPYPLWEHTHRLSPAAGGTEIYDHIRYRVPGGPLAALVQRRLVGRWLDQIFDYRAERLAELLGSAGSTRTGGSSTSKDVCSA